MPAIQFVYVAGPLTKGGEGHNIRRAVIVGAALRRLGYVPFVPHTSWLWDVVAPADYEVWINWCICWVCKCDAVVRIPGESPGADREVEAARAIGLPVAYLPDAVPVCSSLPAVMQKLEGGE